MDKDIISGLLKPDQSGAQASLLGSARASMGQGCAYSIVTRSVTWIRREERDFRAEAVSIWRPG